MHNLDQRRAAYAWEKVQGCSKEYENLAKSAPALIMNNGLMQILAFFETKAKSKKSKDYYKQFNEHICEWLGKQFQHIDEFPKNKGEFNFKAIMTALYQSEPLVYRQATEEALALLRWIRQFAPAVRND